VPVLKRPKGRNGISNIWWQATKNLKTHEKFPRKISTRIPLCGHRGGINSNVCEVDFGYARLQFCCGRESICDWLLPFIPSHFIIYSTIHQGKMSDLFEIIETLPLCIQNVLGSFEREGYDYETCAKYLAILESKGYTFEFGLDCTPFNLTKLD
jgi:hypothetical protein